MPIPRGSRSRSREPMPSEAAAAATPDAVDYDAPIEPTYIYFANYISIELPPVVPADRPQDVRDRWQGWFTHLLDQQGYRNPPLLASTQPSAQRDIYGYFDIVERLPPYLRSGLETDLRDRWNHISENEDYGWTTFFLVPSGPSPTSGPQPTVAALFQRLPHLD